MTKQYRLVVLTNPVAGREDEYNHWYSNQHLGDVTAIPGMVSAQRFKIHSGVTEAGKKSAYKYLAIYEIETDQLDKMLGELQTRPGTPAMPMSDALDTTSASATVFEVITPRVLAKK